MKQIEKLYFEYKQDIYNYLMSITHDPTLSEDILSKTFVKAAPKKPSPTAKWSGTYSTPVIGFAVASKQIQVYFDTTGDRFSKFIEKF